MDLQHQDDWERIIRGLREGEGEIVEAFCRQYGPALGRLADKNLQTGLKRRFDPEDVVQSAFRTFLRRASGGQFRLPDSESLWRLLCAITLTKVRGQARFHLRKKRSPGREVLLDRDSVGDEGASPGVDGGPTPPEIAEFTEQFEKLLYSLDEEERRVVELKLQDYTQTEVAEIIGCSERTVRRILRRIETRLLPST